VKKDVVVSTKRNAPRVAPRLKSISRSFAHGLAQMSSGGLAGPMTWPKLPSNATEALREDWRRLGGDMTRAIDNVRERSLDETT